MLTCNLIRFRDDDLERFALYTEGDEEDFYNTEDARDTNSRLYWNHNWHDPPEARPPERFVIFPKDIEMILGKSIQYGHNYLHLIRDALDKEVYRPVTVDEFCEFTGLDQSLVLFFISESS